jgi:LPXTG-motif cell wall-anchored protein
MPRRALTSIAVAALLALTPAAAFADGAGDEQYQDPLTAPSAPKQTKKKASTAPSTTTPAATTAPAATTTAPTSSNTSSASGSAQELPRTGAPAGLIGLAGGALIASGAALRRRTASQ